MKKKYKRILFCLLAAALLAAGGIAALQPVQVEVILVESGALVDSFTVSGEVQPENSIVLNAGDTGTITSIPYKSGMEVTSGTVLAHIEKSSQAELSIQRQQIEQQLAGMRQEYNNLYGSGGLVYSALDAAQKSFDTAKWHYDAALSASEAYSQADLKELENQMNLAQQELASAQAKLEAANQSYYSQMISSYQSQLATLSQEAAGSGPVTAPFDGVVWQVLTDEGAYIIKNQPLIRLYQKGDMKVNVSVLSEDAYKISAGDRAALLLGDGTELSGTVHFISPVAEEVLSSIGLLENRTVVEISPEGLPEGIGAGYQVDATFSRIAAEEAFIVPASAIVPSGTGSGVYLYIDGKAVLTQVETGARSGGKVVILDGVSLGDQIIANPYDAGVKDGVRAAPL